MKKIRLNMDSLAVETFQTGEDVALRGTVQGQSWLTGGFCDSTGGPWFCDHECPPSYAPCG